MIRQTSIETYHAIEEEGLLGRLQFKVYDAIYKRGPLTQNELHKWCFPDTQPRNVQPRVSELVERGVVAQVGERECSITGRVCIIWDVTDKLPIRPEKTETKDQTIARLTARIKQLEAELANRFDTKGQGSLF